MVPLSDAIPVDAIRKQFPNARESIVAESVDQLRARRAKDVPSLCLFIWDEMVHRGRVGDPFKIAPIINRGYGGIYEFVQRELGEAPVRDAFAVEFFNDLSDKSFVEVSLAHCYPADIHICDVEFSDNRRKVDARDPTRAYRTFKGLHVFDDFLTRLKNVAQENGAERISLMVAFPGLHEVFSRHGFQIGETEMAKKAYAIAGKGYPMFLRA